MEKHKEYLLEMMRIQIILENKRDINLAQKVYKEILHYCEDNNINFINAIRGTRRYLEVAENLKTTL